jgi:hypothetical protein
MQRTMDSPAEKLKLASDCGTGLSVVYSNRVLSDMTRIRLPVLFARRKSIVENKDYELRSMMAGGGLT